LKFVVSGLTRRVTRAMLRLTATGPGPNGGSVFRVGNTLKGTTTAWNDANLSWSTAPDLTGAALGRTGAVVTGPVEIDLGSAVAGNGTYSFALSGASSTSVYYKSIEAGSGAPQLVLTLG
jgi:hypothetical protein